MRTALLLCLLASVVAAEAPTVDKLLSDLDSPDFQTRRKAVLAVEGRTEAELLDKVLAMAEGDDHPNIRGTCADVLATFRDERVFPVLAKMASDESVGPRQHAWVALGRLGDPRCRPILRKALEAGSISSAYAAKGLGLHGDPEDFRVVADFFLAHQRNPYVIELVPEALGRIDGPRARELLIERFPTLSPYARRKAGEVLAQKPGDEVREAMLSHLASTDRHLRQAAVEVLGRSRDPLATPVLVKHLKGRAEDRAMTISALGRIGEKSALPALLPLLKDADAGVRTAAATALGRIGSAAAGPALAIALKAEKGGAAKIGMIEALGRLGDDRAIRTLIPFLEDETYVEQPKRISAIWGFPWNAHVHATAAWAILTLRDGKEPFPVDDLMSFGRGGRPMARIAGDVGAIQAWWAERR